MLINAPFQLDSSNLSIETRPSRVCVCCISTTPCVILARVCVPSLTEGPQRAIDRAEAARANRRRPSSTSMVLSPVGSCPACRTQRTWVATRFFFDAGACPLDARRTDSAQNLAICVPALMTGGNTTTLELVRSSTYVLHRHARTQHQTSLLLLSSSQSGSVGQFCFPGTQYIERKKIPRIPPATTPTIQGKRAAKTPASFCFFFLWGGLGARVRFSSPVITHRPLGHR